MMQSHKQHLILGIEALALLALAMFVRMADLDHAPIHDELQHLMAAQSWAADGEFSIAGGTYDRAALYTVLLASVHSAFDQSVTAARMLSVVLGSVWVVLLFLWARHHISRSVAWTAALLFCFAPGAIFLSQYIRFYALHGVLFFTAAAAFYHIIERRPRGAALGGWGLLLLGSLGAAAHLQFTTLIGCVGLGAYAAYRMAPRVIGAASSLPNARRWMGIGILGVLVLIAGSFVVGVPQKLWEIYRWAPLWSSGGGPLRYHWMMVEQYPVLWATVPIAAIVVFALRSLPGVFCVCLFGSAILLHSFAGMKAERFIYYVMPFFFVLSAILVTELVPYLRQHLDSIATAVGTKGQSGQRLVRGAGLLAALALLVVSNPAMRATADQIRGQHDGRSGLSHWGRYTTDWPTARDVLAPVVADSEVVLTTQGLHLLFYFDRFDIELSASRLSDLYAGSWDETKEFTVDPRTGHPVISSAASFEKVRSCFATGTILIHDNAWRNRVYVPDSVADAIVETSTKIDAVAPLGIRAFTWSSDGFSLPDSCQSIPALAQIVAASGPDR
ncbi:MAG: hypothetical protein AAF417_15220 [Pseudomonadota bacterium]